MTTVMVNLHYVHSSHGLRCRVNDYGTSRPTLRTHFSRTVLWSQSMATVMVDLHYVHSSHGMCRGVSQ